MIREKVKCEICGKMIANCGIKNHIQFHENEKKRQAEREIRKLEGADREDLFCKFCNKQCKNLNSLKQHEIRCKENPGRIKLGDGSALTSYVKANPPMKGQSYSNIDKWVQKDYICKYCGTSSTREANPFTSLVGLLQHERHCRYNPVNVVQHPENVSLLEPELDDDGKLYNKFRMKHYNAKVMKIPCYLTFHEYCTLMKEAGIISSNLGTSGDYYELARYGDKGPYQVGNCRFITHKENMQECETVKKMLASVSASGREQALKKRAEDPERFRERIIQGFQNSPIMQERYRIAEEQRKEYQVNKDPRYTGEHNSQLGSHWITNGEINKKLHPGDEMPEGFHLGRVNGNKLTK